MTKPDIEHNIACQRFWTVDDQVQMKRCLSFVRRNFALARIENY